MIAIDSNVLVRLVVEDDAAEAAAARKLVERAIADRARLFVSTVVLCETVWVLRSNYRLSRAAIGEALSRLLFATHLEVEDAAGIGRALECFAGSTGDFADYVIRDRALSSGADAVATFDKPLLREHGFVHPDPKRWPDDLSLREDSPAYGRRARR